MCKYNMCLSQNICLTEGLLVHKHESWQDLAKMVREDLQAVGRDVNYLEKSF